MAILRITIPDALAARFLRRLAQTPAGEEIDLSLEEDAAEALVRLLVELLSGDMLVEDEHATEAPPAVGPCGSCLHPAEWHPSGRCDASFYNDEPCACLAYVAAGG